MTIPVIPLYEDAMSPTGTFSNYDTYNSAQLISLAEQEHVDIRSFRFIGSTGVVTTMLVLNGDNMLILGGLEVGGMTYTSDTIPPTMFVLDGDSMTLLDTLAVGEMTLTPVLETEGWTAGTVAAQSDRNYFNGISLACTTGANVTASVMSLEVDLAVLNPTGAYVSLSLPAFPAADLTLASCHLDLANGDFSTGTIASVAFSASTISLTGGGDVEASFPLSAFSALDLTAITGVRFRLTATTSCTFRCLAIRAMVPSWLFAPIDQNTEYPTIVPTVPPTGTATPSYTFPASSSPATAWPMLLWAADQAGDPAIKDASVSFFVDTGQSLATNAFTVLFRELAFVYTDLTTFDTMTMGELDGTMADGTPAMIDDYADTNSIQITLNWGASSSVTFGNQSGAKYTLTSWTPSPNTTYYCVVTLSGGTARFIAYVASPTGSELVAFSASAFDSTIIVDPYLFQRRMGRLGWYAVLGDGNSGIRKIRPVRTTYSVYESLPLLSDTPVKGVRLYADTTPDVELFEGGFATVNNSTITIDTIKSNSGQSFRIDCSGAQPNQGIVTSIMRFEDFADTIITFNILAPLTVTLQGFLYSSQGLAYPLPLGPFPINHWTPQQIDLSVLAPVIAPGPWQLYIITADTDARTWYIDKLSVRAKSVAWFATSGVGPSLPFGDAINDPYDGLTLNPGNALQVRADALTQSASISRVQVLPQYAQLGNIQWLSGSDSIGIPRPTASYVTIFRTATLITGNTFAFSYTTVIDNQGHDPGGPISIVSQLWSFGDGTTSTLASPSHTYATDAVWIATLQITDSLGRVWSTRVLP